MHASLRVDAGVYAGDVAAWRNELQPGAGRVLDLRGRIENLDPGEVKSRKVGIVRQDVGGVGWIEQREVEDAGRLDCLGTVENGEAILGPLATVRINRAAHAVVGDARRRDECDLVNGLEP